MDINFGYILAGVSAFIWGCCELRNDSKPFHINNLKQTIIHPISYSRDNNGKLIYVSGPITTENASSLQDELFRISVQGLKLRRKVEMFQWSQEKDASMKLAWSTLPINSSKFQPNFTNPK